MRSIPSFVPSAEAGSEGDEAGEVAMTHETTNDSRPGIWRYSAAGFLATLVLMFVTEPYFGRLRGGRIVPALLFVLYASARLFRFVLGARTVDSEVLCAAVATYLLLGLAWTFS